MGALLVCDLYEHVLPTELVMGLLVFALVFRITASGIGGAFAIALPAGLIAGSLLLVNHLRVHRGAAEVIGSGDVRMIVPLALFSGIDGRRICLRRAHGSARARAARLRQGTPRHTHRTRAWSRCLTLRRNAAAVAIVSSVEITKEQ